MENSYSQNIVLMPKSDWEEIDEMEELIQEILNKENEAKIDDYQLEPIVVVKKNTYTQAHRKAQQKYREKYPDKYCEQQRKLYEEKKKDAEWKKKFNERSRLNNEKYRLKKRQEMLDQGVEIKPRGRPRKNTDDEKDNKKVYRQLTEANGGDGSSFCSKCRSYVVEHMEAGVCKKCADVIFNNMKNTVDIEI